MKIVNGKILFAGMWIDYEINVSKILEMGKLQKKNIEIIIAKNSGYKDINEYVRERNHITGRYKPKVEMSIIERFWSKIV